MKHIILIQNLQVKHLKIHQEYLLVLMHTSCLKGIKKKIIKSNIFYYLQFSFSFIAPCLLDGVPVIRSETTTNSVRTSTDLFSETYDLLNELGSGSYSVCKLAKHKTTGLQYAVKVII